MYSQTDVQVKFFFHINNLKVMLQVMKPAYQSFLEKSLQQAALQATEAAISSNSTVQSNGRLKHS